MAEAIIILVRLFRDSGLTNSSIFPSVFSDIHLFITFADSKDSENFKFCAARSSERRLDAFLLNDGLILKLSAIKSFAAT